eukprot:jgi/Bigna1/62764/fgenesh1_kg.41_\
MRMAQSEVQLIDGKRVDLSIFSLTGGGQHRDIVQVVVMDASVLGFVFSCLDSESLSHIRDWYMRVHNYRSSNSTAVMIGTDYSSARENCTEKEWQNIQDKARKFSKKAKAKALIFCDSDSGINTTILLHVLLHQPLKLPKPSTKNQDAFQYEHDSRVPEGKSANLSKLHAAPEVEWF